MLFNILDKICIIFIWRDNSPKIDE